MKLRELILRYRADEGGATAIEYALVCAIMGLALVAVAATGGALDVLWDQLEKVASALV